jgi:hypothetical protein
MQAENDSEMGYDARNHHLYYGKSLIIDRVAVAVETMVTVTVEMAIADVRAMTDEMVETVTVDRVETVGVEMTDEMWIADERVLTVGRYRP